MSERTRRRLVAIVAADVAGYSRLVGADEEGTLNALRAHRSELIDPLIGEFGGRIANTAGDSLLLEFPSVVDAVRCALAVQQGMAARIAEREPDRQIRFRVGINVGDVVAEGDDLLGDGVNIAARVEGLADAGGIAITDDAYRQVRDRLDIDWQDGGEHDVKNIARPIRVWRWTAEASSAVAPDTPLALPDKPSIAILPFNNMSSDPEQEFFADGMAEDIITGLSRFGSLLVIARNSTFTFKGRAVDVKQVAETLGVRYVLEGSVRRGGECIRVTAQLIDAETGHHIWADRYDREISDLFTVQDEVTDAIISAIAPEIDHAERERARRKPPHQLDVWDLYQRALAEYHSGGAAKAEAAIEAFGRINDIEADFAPAWAMGALARNRYILTGGTKNRDTLVDEAREHAHMALQKDPRDPLSVFADGLVHIYAREYDLGIGRLREAIALNPNNALAHHSLAYAYDAAGRLEESIAAADQAIRLSPRDINISGFRNIRAFALFHLGRDEEAAEESRKAMHSPNPTIWSFVCHAVSSFRLGRHEAARAAMDGLYAQVSDFSISVAQQSLRHHDQEIVAKMLDNLRQLGVPD